MFRKLRKTEQNAANIFHDVVQITFWFLVLSIEIILMFESLLSCGSYPSNVTYKLSKYKCESKDDLGSGFYFMIIRRQEFEPTARCISS